MTGTAPAEPAASASSVETPATGTSSARAIPRAAARSLGPLDEDDGVLEVGLERCPVRLGEALEAVEVEMADAVVPVPDRERRARHRPRNAERAGRSANKGGFPGTELSRDGDDV